MKKLSAIQILRAVAALLVVLAHAILRQADWAPTDQSTKEIANHIGALGVWIFFIISGFIMSYTNYDNFGVSGAPGRFMASRLIRIVPIYWLATAVEVVIRLRHEPGLDVHRLICSLFFIPVAVEPGPTAAMRPILGVGWTLNYEMSFYACFALVLFLSRRQGLAVLLLAMTGAVLAGTFVKPIADTRDPASLIAFYSAPILLLFGVGVLIGAVARLSKGVHANGSSAVLLSVLAAILAVDISLFATFVGTYPAAIEWLVIFWISSAICVVFCAMVRIDDSGWFIQKLVRLGDASYSLYLFHFFTIVAVEKVWWWCFGRQGSLIFVCVSAAAAILAATAIHRFVEQPVCNRLRQLIALVKARRSVRGGGIPDLTRSGAVETTASASKSVGSRFGSSHLTAPRRTTVLQNIAARRIR
jgi:exopolysaccharide production protein ExoZ